MGALLSLVGLSSLIFAIIQGPEDGWTSGRVLPAFLIAGVALAAFVAWELRSDHPMLPLTLFRDRRFSTGTGVITIAFFVMFGFFFLVTQYFQFARGYSPLEAGLATLPAAAHVDRALATQRRAGAALWRRPRDGVRARRHRRRARRAEHVVARHARTWSSRPRSRCSVPAWPSRPRRRPARS